MQNLSSEPLKVIVPVICFLSPWLLCLADLFTTPAAPPTPCCCFQTDFGLRMYNSLKVAACSEFLSSFLLNSSGYFCKCPASFMGTHCEIGLSPCASNPCLYGGTCVPRADDFYCQCRGQYSGQR